MKKFISLFAALSLAAVSVLGFAACGKETDDKTIKIGASPAPPAGGKRGFGERRLYTGDQGIQRLRTA